MLFKNMKLIIALFYLQQCVKSFKYFNKQKPTTSKTFVELSKNNNVLLTPFQRIQNLIDNEKNTEITKNITFVSKKTFGGFDQRFVYNATVIEAENRMFMTNFHKHETLIKLQDIKLTEIKKLDIINTAIILDNMIMLSQDSPTQNIKPAKLNACNLWKKWNE